MPRTRRGLRTVAASAAAPAQIHAAIYTRKSTTAGLDSNFTSLQNQRERGEAFIESQGWSLVSTRFDDGGFSGGNTDRPALQQLFRDVEAGHLDAIVVYRLDRISRSLADFVNIHSFLEKHDVALVSVTESINTQTPHGRMMVNVLVSFSQYERELAGERTRHKIEGARRRGQWTGGRLVLGFDTAPEGGRIVVNKDEAEIVKAIFTLYSEKQSLVAVARELHRRGWRQKAWTAKTGRRCGGGQWNKITLRTLLTNPLYIGMQKLGDEVFPGEHESIVPKKLFEVVQQLLAENRSNGGAGVRNRHGALLRGLLRCSACDAAMTFAAAKRDGRLYKYYRCTAAQKKGAESCPTRSIPADGVEAFVVAQIRRIGAEPELQRETFQQAVGQVKAERRGLKAEAKRTERDLVGAGTATERLVATLTDSTGAARDAVQAELEKAQQRLQTLENRLIEIHSRQTDLDAQEINEADLARALQDFDELWSVLLTPEQERVLRLLLDRVEYHGETQQLTIGWRLAGFAEFSGEVGDG